MINQLRFNANQEEAKLLVGRFSPFFFKILRASDENWCMHKKMRCANFERIWGYFFPAKEEVVQIDNKCIMLEISEGWLSSKISLRLEILLECLGF